MKCPYCSYEESKVVDSRPTDEGERIRRRRECLRCGKRFTTHEVIETVPVVVIKKDKSRETFDRNKLLNGLLRACEKRPVSLDTLERVVAFGHGARRLSAKEMRWELDQANEQIRSFLEQQGS